MSRIAEYATTALRAAPGRALCVRELHATLTDQLGGCVGSEADLLAALRKSETRFVVIEASDPLDDLPIWGEAAGGLPSAIAAAEVLLAENETDDADEDPIARADAFLLQLWRERTSEADRRALADGIAQLRALRHAVGRT